MMANYFSGSSDCSLVSWNRDCSPLSEASLVFYSPDYEQSLMDQYLPTSPSRAEFLASSDDSSSPSSTSSVEGGQTGHSNGNDPLLCSPQYEQALMDQYLPEWRSDFECMAYGGEYSDSIAVDEAAAAADALMADDLAVEEEEEARQEGADYYDVPYESEEYSPSPSPPPVKKASFRPVRYSTIAAPKVSMVHSGEVRKRGRPAGSKSDSKMAVYAKQYREMKKNEASRLSEEVAHLSNDNARLNRENARLAREVQTLRKADSITDKISTLLVTLRANPDRFRLCINVDGTPFLEVV